MGAANSREFEFESDRSYLTFLDEDFFGYDGFFGRPRLQPASKASIGALPEKAMTNGETDCAICLDKFQIGEEAKETPCKHYFHSGCIRKWLGRNGSCPLCRYIMPPENRIAGDELTWMDLYNPYSL